MLLLTTVRSQGYRNDAASNELVHIHLDKQVYVAGEPIKYKAYLINTASPAMPPCSKILYFTLEGSGPDNSLSWRINLDNKSATGSFIIPENIRGGVYVLSAYTNWMRNSASEEYFSERILILNLASGIDPVMRIFNSQSFQSGNEMYANPGISLGIDLEKEEFAANEPVKLEIALKHSNQQVMGADLSISVTAETPFDTLLNAAYTREKLPVPAAGHNRYDPSQACRFRIEDMGYIFSGRIVSNPDMNLNRCDVWLAVNDSISPRILYSQVDSAGEFLFYLNRFYDNKELILQLADPSLSADCKLEVFLKNAVLRDTVTFPYALQSNEEEFLNNVQNIRLIEAIYGEAQPVIIQENHSRGSSFLNMPDRVVIPAEYAEMRNFREAASNIIPEVRFGTRRDEFYLEVLSPNTNSWKKNNTVLLNGVPFTDLAYISTLGTKEIQRIEVIQSNVLIGDRTMPGLVSIFTYDHRIPENYLKSHTVRFQNTVMESYQDIADVQQFSEKSIHYPDFRNSIYWDPFLSASTDRKLVVEFPALLLTGNFVIKVEGFTSDGYPVSASQSFKITEE